MPRVNSPVFEDNYVPGDGCWLWQGRLSAQGYGLFYSKGESRGAHRLSYERAVGPIPDGLVIDHVAARGCISRACVNPAHLEPVTYAENTRRARPAA